MGHRGYMFPAQKALDLYWTNGKGKSGSYHEGTLPVEKQDGKAYVAILKQDTLACSHMQYAPVAW